MGTRSSHKFTSTYNFWRAKSFWQHKTAVIITRLSKVIWVQAALQRQIVHREEFNVTAVWQSCWYWQMNDPFAVQCACHYTSPLIEEQMIPHDANYATESPVPFQGTENPQNFQFPWRTSLASYKSKSQMASQLIQPFLYGSSVWPTHIHTQTRLLQHPQQKAISR